MGGEAAQNPHTHMNSDHSNYKAELLELNIAGLRGCMKRWKGRPGCTPSSLILLISGDEKKEKDSRWTVFHILPFILFVSY